ncbi:SOS response-associated peptidase family protein [Granulicella arctica]|uniref:SOS response-associated peptidase family protein n=1 Tax=Granulicella arctica TaxID=940613 RepID=UPI0037C11FE7
MTSQHLAGITQLSDVSVLQIAANLISCTPLPDALARTHLVSSETREYKRFEKRRRLISVDGFYEWLEPKPIYNATYAITFTTPWPFSCAGISDVWRDAKWLLLQHNLTEPNEAGEHFHHRMCSIIRPSDYHR